MAYVHTLTLMCAVLRATTAIAAPSDREAALAHIERGEQLYSAAKYHEALPEFIAAYEAVAEPELLFHIGQCHARLGHHEEAIFFLSGFLERAAPADRQEVEASISHERQAQRALMEPLPSRRPRPLYKRWWLWTVVGGVVLAASATAIVLTISGSGARLPAGALGTIDAR